MHVMVSEVFSATRRREIDKYWTIRQTKYIEHVEW